MRQRRVLMKGSAVRNYDQKYPLDSDKPGEEYGDNARVWKIYRDEAEEDDTLLVQQYNSIIDVLLVFVSSPIHYHRSSC